MDASKADELARLVAEIRDKVLARHPTGDLGGITLPDLSPILHARDSAEGKVASIGSVNPRPPGLKNSLIQWVKRQVARALDWHVREQVEFNRAIIGCVQAVLEALNENNRALVEVADRLRSVEDLREKVIATEIQYVKNLAELQAAFQHRVAIVEHAHNQHAKLTDSLAAAMNALQQRFWDDMARLRAEQDAVIHSELRVLRQRIAAGAPPAQSSTAPSAPSPSADWSRVDWLRFSDRFRGTEEYIRSQQQIYTERFAGCAHVLDLGCGRGELLETLSAAGISAQGIEINAELAAICRNKGLPVDHADLFEYLPSLEDGSLDAVASLQVVEHIARPRVPEIVQLAYAKLKGGGVLAIETPNPECLAIFATHFYIDPTHRHPLPPALLHFYLEEAGFVSIEVVRLAPAAESMPELETLPAPFRERFFGGLDYVIFGRKPE